MKIVERLGVLTPELPVGSRVAPHAFVLLNLYQRPRSDQPVYGHSHKGIVDSNNKNVASRLELLMVNVSWDVRFTARRA
jgi:hypothetical protein